MKKNIQILSLLIIFLNLESCQKTPFTCRFSGEKQTRSYPLPDFDTVEINTSIEVKIFHSNENKIEITTDKDVMGNIEYEIINNKLSLTNTTGCFIQNSDAIAYINLYVDDIHTLIANTDLDIFSGNIWHFDQLRIICENAQIGTNNIADFNLQIAMNKLSVSANGSSIFNISGTCQSLYVGFYGGNPIFKGKNLMAQKIGVFQRSDADMHLYPIQEIKGDLFGYGDIYLYHRPSVIQIRKHYAGHIYFVN